ncbi:MAG TPA: aminoacyl-tRNA hydrolase [Blastocatellia bacterium]|nr:aminoacyl-tRNA hydrolase [Blastocatellia bacterium]
MRVIVGLGNPGREYEETRHNLGFMLIDKLLKRAGGRRYRDEVNAKVAEVAMAGERVLLAKPQTFMNSSGGAVVFLLARYGDGDAGNLIVASDDVALPLGMIRVRARGSAGGQKGLASIIEAVGANDFVRIRLGAKPDHPVGDLVQFVLSPIPKRDREAVEQMLERGADAVAVVLEAGVERAMALFNQRIKAAAVDGEQ